MKKCPHCGVPILTKREKEVLAVVPKHPPITSTDVAKKLDMTLPNAENYLTKLAGYGLISKMEDVHASGGLEYIYVLKGK